MEEHMFLGNDSSEQRRDQVPSHLGSARSAVPAGAPQGSPQEARRGARREPAGAPARTPARAPARAPAGRPYDYSLDETTIAIFMFGSLDQSVRPSIGPKFDPRFCFPSGAHPPAWQRQRGRVIESLANRNKQKETEEGQYYQNQD